MVGRRPDHTGGVIEALELTKRYGQATVVDGLTFTVRPGMVTGFLGPNGAGKSTTMRMALGLTRPDHGTARIGGCAYAQLTEPLRHVGTLLEAAAPYRGLRAADHLRWVADSNRICRHRVAEVLELVGLAGAGQRRVGTFSLGMGQRLGLATAMLGDPAVLVLDEPVNGLDAEGIRWFRHFARGLAAEGRTVFISSHLMAEMAVAADHLIVISQGRLLADAPAAEFVERNARAHVRVRAAEPERFGAVLRAAGIPGTAAADGTMTVTGTTAAEISRIAAANGVTLHELSSQPGSLEDAFLGLTGPGLAWPGAGSGAAR